MAAQGHISVLFGLPDLGGVCSNHVGDYLQKADALKAAGVQKLYCVSVSKVSVLDQWLKEKGAAKCIQGIADDTGAFTRMLGVNVSDPQQPQLRSQRYY